MKSEVRTPKSEVRSAKTHKLRNCQFEFLSFGSLFFGVQPSGFESQQLPEDPR